MLKFTVLTMIVVGLVVANAARRNMGVGRSQSKAAKNIDKGDPSPSEESSHGSCGGCTEESCHRDHVCGGGGPYHPPPQHQGGQIHQHTQPRTLNSVPIHSIHT